MKPYQICLSLIYNLTNIKKRESKNFPFLLNIPQCFLFLEVVALHAAAVQLDVNAGIV